MLYFSNATLNRYLDSKSNRCDWCLLQVALLDIDICGPSIPRLMGLEGEQVHQSGSGWSPVVSTPV